MPKGHTNNPNGRPKQKKAMQLGLRSALNDKYGKFDKGMYKIAEELVELATNRESSYQLAAIKEISDRLDGKPAQAIIGDDNESPVSIKITWEE